MTFFIETIDQRCKILSNLLTQNGHQTKDIQQGQQAQAGDFLIFPPNKKFFDEEILNLKHGTTLICGNLHSTQEEMLKQKNITHHNLLKDETFAIKNSMLTAEGVLANILTKTNKSIFDLNILVLGFGRVGKSVAKILNDIGATFAVASHDKNNYALAHIFRGKHLFANEFLGKLPTFDVIVNSVPARIIPENYIATIKPDCLFLEIASIETIVNCGLDFYYEPCPALPQKFSATSAGKVLFESIIKMIK